MTYQIPTKTSKRESLIGSSLLILIVLLICVVFDSYGMAETYVITLLIGSVYIAISNYLDRIGKPETQTFTIEENKLRGGERFSYPINQMLKITIHPKSLIFGKHIEISAVGMDKLRLFLCPATEQLVKALKEVNPAIKIES